jgi:outer membrane biosynthesis protein TonB
MKRSMRGVEIDIAKLIARQEKNITVGNTKSNARGDQLGKGGRIVKSADELAREHYNRNDPKAVVQGGIKADADTPEILQTRVEEIAKPQEDDWKEPEPTKPAETPEVKPATTPEVKPAAMPSPEPVHKPVPEPVPEPVKENKRPHIQEIDDPWVEDKDGNFVRRSELHQQEQNERVSKPKAKHQPKSNKKKK